MTFDIFASQGRIFFLHIRKTPPPRDLCFQQAVASITTPRLSVLTVNNLMAYETKLLIVPYSHAKTLNTCVHKQVNVHINGHIIAPSSIL